MFSTVNLPTTVQDNAEGFVRAERKKGKKGLDVTADLAFAFVPNKPALHVFSGKQQKSTICKSVKDGVPCTYGNKCIFSHYADDVKPNDCQFGDACFRVKYTERGVKNANSKSVCFNIHPDENISCWLSRNGYDESLMQRPVQDPTAFKCTRMCISVIDNIPCVKGDECTYAHKVEELKTNPCNFGVDCHNVRKDGDEYVNNETDKICIFLHPEESLKNYEARALRIIAAKKRKSVEDINTQKAKKPRVELSDAAFPLVAMQPVAVPNIEAKEFKPVEDKIILNVPAHMAVEMLHMLFKNGKTNVELITY